MYNLLIAALVVMAMLVLAHRYVINRYLVSRRRALAAAAPRHILRTPRTPGRLSNACAA